MFDIGFSELVVIGLIALIVLGPKRLPEVARTTGRWLGQLRRFISEVKQDLDREIHTEDLAELHKLKQELSDTRNIMESTSGELLQGFSEINPASTTPISHAGDSTKPASSETPVPVTPVKRSRPSSSKKSQSGKQHGGTRKSRRR